MAQKIVLKLLAAVDEKTKKKAVAAVADVHGVDLIEVDSKERKMTVVGEIDPVTVVRKLKKVGGAEIVSFGPAKDEKKDGKK